ncbi:MAG: restriction endonuclease [Dokdonella sp.]
MSRRRNVHSHDDSLSRTHWASVEALLATHYRGRGYQVEHTGTGNTGARFDGGIDLKLRKGDEFILVDCKHWKSQVPHNYVHQLIGLMVNHSATGAILATSGEFTKYAIESANKHGHVQLIDGTQLRAMLGPLPEPVADAEFSRAANGAMAASHGRGRAGRRYGAHGPASRLIAKLGAGFISAAVFWLFMQFVLNRVSHTLVPAHGAAPASQSARVQPPPLAREAFVSAPTEVSNEEASTRARARSDAELTEWQRKNAESMKILEKTTPEAR